MPQEFAKMRQLGTRRLANRFLRDAAIAEFNRLFQAGPAQRGNAFVHWRSP